MWQLRHQELAAETEVVDSLRLLPCSVIEGGHGDDYQLDLLKESVSQGQGLFPAG